MKCVGCTECGDCCRVLHLMPEEFLNKNGIKHTNGVCNMLINSKCSIYESRPEVCRVKEWTKEHDKSCEVIQNVFRNL